jgi:hypothetical protein
MVDTETLHCRTCGTVGLMMEHQLRTVIEPELVTTARRFAERVRYECSDPVVLTFADLADMGFIKRYEESRGDNSTPSP